MESKDMEEPVGRPEAALAAFDGIHEVLPKSGIVYSERDSFQNILAKPKIMPLKSVVLQKLEKLEAEANEA
jgi:BBSome-interacting protein 1